MSSSLLARVRWVNVAVALGAVALLALVVLWPRLSPAAPAVPPAAAAPSAPAAPPPATATRAANAAPTPGPEITEARLKAPRPRRSHANRGRRRAPHRAARTAGKPLRVAAPPAPAGGPETRGAGTPAPVAAAATDSEFGFER
jgi:hypothetical protein